MMVPRNRLLWIAAALLPLDLLAALRPQWIPLCAGLYLAAAAIAAWDASRARRRLRGWELSLADARFTLGKPGALTAALRGSADAPLRMRLALDLPSLLSPSFASTEIALVPGAGEYKVNLEVTPCGRGRDSAKGYVLETESPLGLWNARKPGRLVAEIKVYPGLKAAGGRIALPEQLPMPGIHHRRRIGKGREFDKLREYLHGDDYHDIHWKATAKRGFPVTKVFQVENTQQAYIILDASRLSAVRLDAGAEAPQAGPQTTSRTIPQPMPGAQPLEYFLRAALRLGMAAERQGDYYGLMIHSDRPQFFLPAGKGKPHYGRFRDALLELRAGDYSPDYAEIFSALRLRIRKRALLVFLGSLDEPAQAEAFAEGVCMISRQHLISVAALKPSGMLPIFQGPLPADDGEVYARMADQIRLRGLDRLGRDLRRQGVAFKAWEPRHFSAEAVGLYLEAKHRRSA